MAQSEKELVAEVAKIAKAMNVYLEFAGQLKARGSGSTIGLPDCFAYVSGKVIPIEFKTKTGRLSPGQALAQHKRMDQHVFTWVIRDANTFIELINMVRRGKV